MFLNKILVVFAYLLFPVEVTSSERHLRNRGDFPALRVVCCKIHNSKFFRYDNYFTAQNTCKLVIYHFCNYELDPLLKVPKLCIFRNTSRNFQLVTLGNCLVFPLLESYIKSVNRLNNSLTCLLLCVLDLRRILALGWPSLSLEEPCCGLFCIGALGRALKIPCQTQGLLSECRSLCEAPRSIRACL